MSGPAYQSLPEPVRIEDTVEEVDVRPVPDPGAGTNRDQLDAVEAGG